MIKARQTNDQRDVLERQALICKAFANSTRLHILRPLCRSDWAAGELQEELAISKPNLSHHITVLKVAGLIRRQRQGKQVNLSLAMPEVKRACELIGTMLHTQIRNGRTLLESGGRPYKQPPQRREMPL